MKQKEGEKFTCKMDLASESLVTTLATPVYFPLHTGVPLIVSDTINVSEVLDIGLGTPKIISGNRKSSHVDFRNFRRRLALELDVLKCIGYIN